MNNQTKPKRLSFNPQLKRDLSYLIPAFIIFTVSIFIVLGITSKSVHAEEEIVVYKSPTCSCCNRWVKHLEKEGFDVKTKNYRDMKPIKKTLGVEQKFQSCHTAKIGQYFIEGHVSASDIKKLLKEKPDIKGLAAPGMPMGSPGMEGRRKDKYNVLAIDKNNKSTIYTRH